MNANELRIGNYVNLEYGGIYEVININSEGFDYVDLRKPTFKAVGRFDINSIKPIPLTEEWLLKCGFEKIIFGFSTFYDLYFNPRFVLRFYMIPNELDLIQDDRKLSFKASHVLYVHQLQNLYFALSGKELVVSDAVS
jgi:hypothetical protein